MRGSRPAIGDPQFNQPLVVQRGGEKGETLLHPVVAIGESRGGRHGDLRQGLAAVQPLPDKAPEIIEPDLGVRHEPPEMVERTAETSRFRFGPLHDDPPVPIGLPGAEPMGNAAQNLVFAGFTHDRERWSGSHTSSAKSNG